MFLACMQIPYTELCGRTISAAGPADVRGGARAGCGRDPGRGGGRPALECGVATQSQGHAT